MEKESWGARSEIPKIVDEVAISFCDNAYGGELPNPVRGSVPSAVAPRRAPTAEAAAAACATSPSQVLWSHGSPCGCGRAQSVRLCVCGGGGSFLPTPPPSPAQQGPARGERPVGVPRAVARIARRAGDGKREGVDEGEGSAAGERERVRRTFV